MLFFLIQSQHVPSYVLLMLGLELFATILKDVPGKETRRALH